MSTGATQSTRRTTLSSIRWRASASSRLRRLRHLACQVRQLSGPTGNTCETLCFLLETGDVLKLQTCFLLETGDVLFTPEEIEASGMSGETALRPHIQHLQTALFLLETGDVLRPQVAVGCSAAPTEWCQVGACMAGDMLHEC